MIAMLPSRNFIDLTKKEQDAPIYRTMTAKRLLEIIQNKTLALVRPHKWNDPFENFLMNATGELPNGEKILFASRDKLYGQCWTFTKESEAHWRVYAPEGDGVKVKTTPIRLLSALYGAMGKFKAIQCFIGRVRYLRKKEVQDLLEDSRTLTSLVLDSTGRGQAQSLLFKRFPFSYEHEVRIIYHDVEGRNSTDIFSFPVDPLSLFDEIIFDPRMKYSDFRRFKNEFARLGFVKRMVKSKLYSIPDIAFKLTT